jgi:hypothetical protein
MSFIVYTTKCKNNANKAYPIYFTNTIIQVINNLANTWMYKH